jgi:ABC-type multidrug transport system ATPase subunit
VPDDPQPFDALTVEEHLEFTAALYGLADGARARDELLARFELAGSARRSAASSRAACARSSPAPAPGS